MKALTLWTVLGLSAVVTPAFAHTSSRFRSFFGNSEQDFGYVSSVTCNASLATFQQMYADSSAVAAIDLGLHSQAKIIEACKAHENCILNNVPQSTLAMLSTAGVVLGLLPTLLAVLSPSIDEIALLCTQRPFLGMISTLGSPAVLQTRVFEYSDPTELLDVPEDIYAAGRRIRLQLVLGPWRNGWGSTFVALGEWVLILAAVVNTQWLSVQLSRNSILSWGCTRAIWPTVLWSCIPLLINGVGVWGYHLTLDSKKGNAAGQPKDSNLGAPAPSRTYSFFTKPESNGTVVTTDMNYSDSPPQSSSIMFGEKSRTAPPGFFSRMSARIRGEFIPCACHPVGLRARLTHGQIPSPRVTVGVILYCCAGFLSFFHLFYGTVTFSGLLFVDMLDAIGQIAMRLLASCLICRFVVLIEVSGMRGAVAAAAAAR